MKTRSAAALPSPWPSWPPPLAPAGDWPNWRGPHRDGTSAETGLVSTWSKTGENLVWKASSQGDVTARATPVVFDGRVCASARAGTGLLRQEIVACFDAGTARSSGSAASPSTTPRSRSAAWAGPASPATPRPATSTRRTWTASSWPSTGPARRSGSGGSARRSAAARATAAAPSSRSSTRTGVIIERRGRGLGRHGRAASALRGLRQAHGRRALGLDALRRAVRGRQQPGEPHRRRRSAGSG